MSVKKLGEILIDKGIINQKQLEDALCEQKRTKEYLGDVLIRRAQILEKDLLEVISKQFDIPFINLKYRYIDWSLTERFSSSLILDHKCIPLSKEGRKVIFAITLPVDMWLLKQAEDEARKIGLNVKPVIVLTEDMNDALARYKEYIRGKI